MGNAVMAVTDEDFEARVLQSASPVLVDFTASWCAPCRVIAPILDELAVTFAGKVAIAKIDVDTNKEVAQHYGVRGLPTLLVFKNGEVVDQVVGAAPRAKLEATLQKWA